ncbi:MAG: toluene hydroxylase [Actinobacteria bacterium]|nr:toluene hydroxylase [Actinomycetota bacterium]
MTDVMPERPARRLKTWSSLGKLRRLPSEYEIVTHGMNYTTRTGRFAALESNPTTPTNMWFLTYRDHSPLRAEDWSGFRDPDELTYRKYVTIQDEQETVVEGILDEYGPLAHDQSLEPEWIEFLSTVFTPTRFPAHALQMSTAYMAQMAPSSYITNCALFAGADLLRRVSLVAYRTRQLNDATSGVAGIGVREREVWQAHEAWQPARQMLEYLLVAYDWGECFTAMNLVVRPSLDSVLLTQAAELAHAGHDELTWLLLSNLAADWARVERWSTGLARHAIEQRGENREVMLHWIDRWAPRADAAVSSLAGLLAAVPGGPDQGEVVANAVAARDRVIAAAGITG